MARDMLSLYKLCKLHCLTYKEAGVKELGASSFFFVKASRVRNPGENLPTQAVYAAVLGKSDWDSAVEQNGVLQFMERC